MKSNLLVERVDKLQSYFVYCFAHVNHLIIHSTCPAPPSPHPPGLTHLPWMYVIQQRFRTHLIPLTPGYQSHNTLPFFSGKLKIKLPLNYLKICVITRCQRKACNRATAQAVSLRNHVLNPKIRHVGVWWTVWHWNRFLSEFFGITLRPSFPNSPY